MNTSCFFSFLTSSRKKGDILTYEGLCRRHYTSMGKVLIKMWLAGTIHGLFLSRRQVNGSLQNYLIINMFSNFLIYIILVFFKLIICLHERLLFLIGTLQTATLACLPSLDFSMTLYPKDMVLLFFVCDIKPLGFATRHKVIQCFNNTFKSPCLAQICSASHYRPAVSQTFLVNSHPD